MDINDVKQTRDLLNSLCEIEAKIIRLDNILGTDRNDTSKRNIAGFLVSPTLYYSVYEQIKSEYMNCYNELKSKIKQI